MSIFKTMWHMLLWKMPSFTRCKGVFNTFNDIQEKAASFLMRIIRPRDYNLLDFLWGTWRLCFFLTRINRRCWVTLFFTAFSNFWAVLFRYPDQAYQCWYFDFLFFRKWLRCKICMKGFFMTAIWYLYSIFKYQCKKTTRPECKFT